MNGNLEHLNEAARAAVDLPIEERLKSLRQARWITYSRAKEILARLEDLLLYPPTHRMPCALVVGETNNGKTAIMHRFERLHPASDNPNGSAALVPVLTVQAPPIPEENRFYASILDALNAPYRATESAARRQVQVLKILKAVGIRLLVIDEVHHIVAGYIGKQRVFLNVLKYMANDLRIPLIAVGTVDAVRAIQADPQLANRFEPLPLPTWELNREFQTLLASFERTLPLRRPSLLAQERLAAKLLSMSEGTIGELSRLLIAAASEAIRGGQERIDEATLRRLNWQPPSERKRRAEGLLSWRCSKAFPANSGRSAPSPMMTNCSAHGSSGSHARTGVEPTKFWRQSSPDPIDLQWPVLDYLPPEKLLSVLSKATATPPQRVLETTLLAVGSVQFIPRVNALLRYCPMCLSEDPEPYFRREWQMSAFRLCDRHNCLICCHCRQCRRPQSVDKIPLEAESISCCSHCGADLRQQPPIVKTDVMMIQEWQLRFWGCVREVPPDLSRASHWQIVRAKNGLRRYSLGTRGN